MAIRYSEIPKDERRGMCGRCANQKKTHVGNICERYNNKCVRVAWDCPGPIEIKKVNPKQRHYEK